MTVEQESGDPVARSFDEFNLANHDRLSRAIALATADADVAGDAVDEAMARAAERWDSISRYDAPVPSAAELESAGRPSIALVTAELRYDDDVYRSEDGTARFDLIGPPTIPGSLTIEYRDAAGAIIDYIAIMIPPGPFAAG